MKPLETKNNPDNETKPKAISTISTRLSSGEIIELVYLPESQKTQLAVWQNGEWNLVDSFEQNGNVLIPYSAKNNLIRHKVILLPSQPMEYGNVEQLSAEIQSFLHHYTDISPVFETIAVSYILLSWVYESFNELSYLRFRGDPGSGKTRSLLTIGSLCYKPIMASGASTVSPIFRLLDSIRGTLILDEGDFRFSDEKAEIIKILNNGNAKGFPVLRSELVNKQEFDPRAYHVFGPKVIATRNHFSDPALESRCLTEDMRHHRVRSDVPLNLPEIFTTEAENLRNKLLLYRFRYLSGMLKQQQSPYQFTTTTDESRKLEPRMKQLLVPLLSVTVSQENRIKILNFAESYQRDLLTERSTEIEAQVVEVLFEMARINPTKISIKELTSAFIKRFADDYERKITPKWIGSIVRRKLGLKTYKSNGLFFIPQKELSKLNALAERYGVGDSDIK